MWGSLRTLPCPSLAWPRSGSAAPSFLRLCISWAASPVQSTHVGPRPGQGMSRQGSRLGALPSAARHLPAAH